MLSTGPNYAKLKTNLRLSINRLKLLEKKKTELAQKARKEIADYIVNGKYERAKIRVEHIIREDYLVEAMEVVEMYCDLLLARFGLIQQMKTLDEGLTEAISSLIWAAPRLQADVAELKTIADQLAVKYGKPYAQAARENGLNSVNEKLMHKLNVQAPPKLLVEKYLIEIAKSHNVSYEPDVDVLKEEEATEALSDNTLIDLGEEGGLAKPPEPGFVIGGDAHRQPVYPGVQYPQPQPPRPFNYPVSNKELEANSVAPPVPSMPPSGPYPTISTDSIGFNVDMPAPPYGSVVKENPPPSTFGASDGKPVPAPRTKFPADTLPELPSVPNTVLPDLDTAPDENSEEVDFDDLAKRFEELKKRK